MTAHRRTPIPFFRPHLPPIEDYVALLEEIWDSRMLSNFGPFSQRLEQLAKSFLGSQHVLAVVSCDIGLMIVLRGLELPTGSPCFVSDFTFNSTINAPLWNGLKPVLVDIDPGTFNLDPHRLAEAMETDPRPGVVLATHVFGNPCDVDRLQLLARDHGSYLVFDAAHAYGSTRDGLPAGRFGDAEVFSLSGTKLTTSAEGGLISTPHDWLAERLVYLRAYGFQYDYDSRFAGINGKISELHSALGLLTLGGAEAAVGRRKEIVDGYRRSLGDRVGWQLVRTADRCTYKDLIIDLGDRRDVVTKALAEADVATKNYFRPLHSQQAYARYASWPTPASSRAYDTTLCVPVFGDLTDDDVDFVASIILSALDG